MAKNYKIAKLEGIDSNGNEKISLVDTLEINIKADTINVKDRIETKDINSTGLISGANINASGNINGANVEASGNINGLNVEASGNINGVNVEASGNIKGVNVEATSSVSGNVLNATENINSSKVTTDNLKSKSGSVIGSDNLSFTAATGSEKSIDFIMAENDAAHIKVGGGYNEGYLELATKDDGREPIYVRQYGSSSTRTATLLDGSGNTSFPGTVSAGGKTLATTESVNNTNSTIADHTGNKTNPHEVTKAQIGLGDVDNTSDEKKPLSKAAREAFNNVAYTAIQCDIFNSDDPGKGVTPAAAKKAVTTFGLLNTGGKINGDLKITNKLSTNSFAVESDASISSLVVNNNLKVNFNNVLDSNSSNISLQTKLNNINQNKVDKNGNSTITGNLTIKGHLHPNSIGVDDLANIELIGNGNLQNVVDEINTSIEEVSKSASDAGAKATQAISQIDYINQNKLGKNETALSANGVVDYGNLNKVIKISWADSSLSTTQYFAAYDSTGDHIKTISVDNTKTVLGINNKMDKDAIIFEFDSNTKTLNIKTK